MTRNVRNLLVYLFIMVMLANITGCASSKKNARSERPKKGKMKPCGCPTFGQYNISYAEIVHYC